MRCVKALLAFFTAVPLKAPELDFTCAWALPYVAAPVVGGAGAAAYAATHDPLVSYLVLLLATGLNHLDGLADSADALMVRDREKARAVLDDPRKGTAGVFAVAVVVALAATASPHSPPDYLAADLYSKALTVVAAGNSRPFKPGLGALFVETLRRRWPLAAPGLALAAVYNPAAAAAAAAASLLLFLALYRHLGGVNGDVFGALLEVSRAAYLYALGRTPLAQGLTVPW